MSMAVHGMNTLVLLHMANVTWRFSYTQEIKDAQDGESIYDIIIIGRKKISAGNFLLSLKQKKKKICEEPLQKRRVRLNELK